MSTAVPTMTSMLATAPTTYNAYAAAPTMTSMYATPGPSMYMPATTYQASLPASTVVAAPVATTVAAPMTASTVVAAPTATPSYVAAPAMAAPAVVEEVVAGFPPFAAPAPMSLTAGLVPPEKVEAERLGYEKALAAQLEKQSNATLEEAKIKKAMLEQTAKTQLAQYQLQIEENFKMACLQVDQEAQNMLMGLKEAAITQQTAREEIAAIAVADYNKKKALEEMSIKSYQLQKTWYDNEMKLTAEYQKVMKAGSKSVITPSMPVAPVATPYVI